MSNATKRDQSYAELVLAGRASYADIDDFITAWHQAPDDSAAARMEIYQFLGLSWEEYRLWGEQPSSLKFTFAARKAKLPISDVLQDAKRLPVAARANSENDATKVYDWLVARGRIKPNPER